MARKQISGILFYLPNASMVNSERAQVNEKRRHDKTHRDARELLVRGEGQ